MRAFTATTLAEYDAALREAFTWQEPCLIDVHVDPAGYAAQAKALRG
jgi:thiamine pyrophosphate-dependent acetolactate synthase large subunit-like protein